MSISVSQNPRRHPQMSYFVHNPKIISLLPQRRKETRKYSHSRSCNHSSSSKELTFVFHPQSRIHNNFTSCSPSVLTRVNQYRVLYMWTALAENDTTVAAITWKCDCCTMKVWLLHCVIAVRYSVEVIFSNVSTWSKRNCHFSTCAGGYKSPVKYRWL